VRASSFSERTIAVVAGTAVALEDGLGADEGAWLGAAGDDGAADGATDAEGEPTTAVWLAPGVVDGDPPEPVRSAARATPPRKTRITAKTMATVRMVPPSAWL
jgi:hypothetical protein